jgi:hypothetical protein
VDTDGDGLTVGLVLDDTLDVDDVFEAVDRGDLAFATLVEATNNSDLVVLSDRNGSNLKIGLEGVVRRNEV